MNHSALRTSVSTDSQPEHLPSADTSPELSQIQYTVSVASTSEHLYHIAMKVSLESPSDNIQLCLAAWIPGSYMIRDFAKHLHNLTCEQNEVNLAQSDKQTWSVKSKTKRQEFTFTYTVYAFDLSVRSAFINEQYAFFNGTSLFLSVKGLEDVDHVVNIVDFAELENNVITGLPITANKQNTKHGYLAQSFHELIDHPFILGQVQDYCFVVGEHTFHLVFTGNDSLDLPTMEHDLTPIIEHHISLFGDFPCKEYWFMTLICENGFGGLEHSNSTVLQFSRKELLELHKADKISKSYQQFLSLCSHELFHTWHVKRIRPEVMLKPDLSKEVYTPQLWIYEGFTSLYDDLSLARTERITPEEYLQLLSEVITRLYRTPGRAYQSVSQSSLEAWSKFYKQDAGSINHIVSYYNKGAIVALCLDITLRQLSENTVSLDHVMKKLWQDYGSVNKGTKDDVIETLCKHHFGLDISGFIHMATQSTLELPLSSLLQYIGLDLSFRPSQGHDDKGGRRRVEFTKDFGATLVNKPDGIYISSCLANRAASASGLQVGDKIIALNQFTCDEKSVIQIINKLKVGDTIPLHIIRDGRLLELAFTIHEAVKDTCELAIRNELSFLKWLGK